MSKLLNDVRKKLRVHHYGLKTEKKYVQWIVRATPQRRIPVVLSQQEVIVILAGLRGATSADRQVIIQQAIP